MGLMVTQHTQDQQHTMDLNMDYLTINTKQTKGTNFYTNKINSNTEMFEKVK